MIAVLLPTKSWAADGVSEPYAVLSENNTVLTFDVQTITHETKGTIAPFGNTASNRHFWLRELGGNGLQNATSIKANTPYIISMPWYDLTDVSCRVSPVQRAFTSIMDKRL